MVAPYNTHAVTHYTGWFYTTHSSTIFTQNSAGDTHQHTSVRTYKFFKQITRSFFIQHAPFPAMHEMAENLFAQHAPFHPMQEPAEDAFNQNAPFPVMQEPAQNSFSQHTPLQAMQESAQNSSKGFDGQAFFSYDFVSGWYECETYLLQDLTIQGMPSGTYTIEPPPEFWQQLATRMAKWALTARDYTPEVCQRQYLNRIKPLFDVFPRPPHLCQERSWSETETELLRSFIHSSYPGGQYYGVIREWERVKDLMIDAAIQERLPFRLYSSRSIRDHYYIKIWPNHRILEAQWPNAELDLLRTYIPASEPGGQYTGRNQTWENIQKQMSEIPYRIYNEGILRDQYLYYIRPRFL